MGDYIHLHSRRMVLLWKREGDYSFDCRIGIEQSNITYGFDDLHSHRYQGKAFVQ